MQINAPIHSNYLLKEKIDAGADTFYAGIDFKSAFNLDDNFSNRRPWISANFTELSEFVKASDLIHKYNKKLFLTVNEHFYKEKFYDKIVNIVKALHKNKVIDGVIIADLNLLLKLNKKIPDLNKIASTGFHIFNIKSVLFFKNLGIKHIILPRQLTIDEIKRITDYFKNTDIKFEIFIKNEACMFVDGLCMFSHGIKLNNSQSIAYCLAMKLEKIKNSEKKEKKIIRSLNRLSKQDSINGICSLFFLKKANIEYLKIVGRDLPDELILKDIKIIKFTIDQLNKKSFKEFKNKIMNKNYELYKVRCNKLCLFN